MSIHLKREEVILMAKSDKETIKQPEEKKPQVESTSSNSCGCGCIPLSVKTK